MPWNTPGSGGSDNNNGDARRSWRPSQGGRIDAWLQNARDQFGGSPGRWIGVAIAVWLVLNSFVLVTEQQRGVVLRLGQFSRVLQPGPHFKLPWPLESVTKVNATEINTYSDNVPVLTRDTNMVSVDLNVQYQISNPELYLFGTRDAVQVLQEAALSTVREQVGRSDLDTVLNSRGTLVNSVRDRLQSSLDTYKTGLRITGLQLQNARPPDQVKDAFDEAQRATADKQTSINQAQAYAAQVVPEARGEAARLRAAAIGYKSAEIARATGDAERFSLLVDQYKSAPDVTRKRLWLDTVQEVLAQNRKVVGGDGRQLIYIPMPVDSKAAAGTANAPNVVPADMVSPTVTTQGTQSRPDRAERPASREGEAR